MEKIVITNNTVDNFVIISPTKPQMGFIPEEESQVFKSRAYDYSPTNDTEFTESADTYNDENDLLNGEIPASDFTATGTGTGVTSGTGTVDGFGNMAETGTIDSLDITITPNNGLKKNLFVNPMNGAHMPTKYIGITTLEVPHMIRPEFADFKMLNVLTNPLGLLNSGNPESAIEDLFDITDSSPKITTIFNSLQALRLPINRFNDINVSPVVNNYGKYYIKISPKYIDTEVTSIVQGSHLSWSELIQGTTPVSVRRTVYKTNNSTFSNSPWVFEEPTHYYQKGRLYGSIVEVWDNGLSQVLCQKIIAENTLGLSGTTGLAEFVLTPNTIGYDSPLEVINIGNILRIYPRETYFKPIFIEVEYKNSSSTLEGVLAYMNNDAVRSLENGIIEIYDESGVQIDNQGNLTGTVVQKYQLSKEGVNEVRRKITL